MLLFAFVTYWTRSLSGPPELSTGRRRPHSTDWRWRRIGRMGQGLQFPPLKDGWVMKKDMSQGGRPYFYNENLNITQWVYPH